jgi:hypothetical protein
LEAIENIVRHKLLVKASHDLGIELSEEAADSLRDVVTRELMAVASVGRLRRDELVAGDHVIEANVERVMREMAMRQRATQSIERVLSAMLYGGTVRIYPERYAAVVRRVDEIRRGAVESGS